MKYFLKSITERVFLESEVEEVTTILQTLKKSLFTKKGLEGALKETPSEVSDMVQKVMEENNLTYSDKTLEGLFSELETKMGELPKVQIAISFVPSQSFLEEVKKSVSESVSSAVLQVTRDERILAGCSISWKGVFKDYSLARTLETI